MEREEFFIRAIGMIKKYKSNRFVKKLQKKEICVRMSFRQGTADSKDIY